MNRREIVVATDFTDVAEHACHYACEMATAYKLPLTIVNAYSVPITLSDTPMPILSIDETKDLAVEGLKKIKTKLQDQFPDIEITAKALYGDIYTALEDYESNHQPFCFILGNSGADSSNRWLGSQIADIMRKTSALIIAVPIGVNFRPIKKIALSCDVNYLVDHFPSERLASIYKLTAAKITLLHISDIEISDAETMHKLTELRAQFNYPLETTIIHSDNVNNSIERFVTDEAIDWIMIMPQKHSFFYNLFNRTHTDYIVRIDQTPTVAIH